MMQMRNPNCEIGVPKNDGCNPVFDAMLLLQSPLKKEKRRTEKIVSAAFLQENLRGGLLVQY